MIVLVGAPGSGKTTYRKSCLGFVTICPDEIRGEIGGSEDNQSVSSQAFTIARERCEAALVKKQSVIIDATNMYRQARKQWLKLAEDYGVQAEAVVFLANKQTLLDRNLKRGSDGGRNVPEFVIDSMLSKYQVPTLSEGFTKIIFKNNECI